MDNLQSMLKYLKFNPKHKFMNIKCKNCDKHEKLICNILNLTKIKTCEKCKPLNIEYDNCIRHFNINEYEHHCEGDSWYVNIFFNKQYINMFRIDEECLIRENNIKSQNEELYDYLIKLLSPILPQKEFDTIEEFWIWIENTTADLYSVIKDIITFYLFEFCNNKITLKNLKKAYEYSIINILFHNSFTQCYRLDRQQIRKIFNNTLFNGNYIFEKNINIKELQREYEEIRKKLNKISLHWDQKEIQIKRIEEIVIYIKLDINLYKLLKLLNVSPEFDKHEIDRNSIIEFKTIDNRILYCLRPWINLDAVDWLRTDKQPKVFDKFLVVHSCRSKRGCTEEYIEENKHINLTNDDVQELINLKVKDVSIDYPYDNPDEFIYDQEKSLFIELSDIYNSFIEQQLEKNVLISIDDDNLYCYFKSFMKETFPELKITFKRNFLNIITEKIKKYQ
jgi:ribosomal protein S27E